MPKFVYAVIHDSEGNFLIAIKCEKGYFFHSEKISGNGTIYQNGKSFGEKGEKPTLPGGNPGRQTQNEDEALNNALKELEEETNFPAINLAFSQVVKHYKDQFWAFYLQVDNLIYIFNTISQNLYEAKKAVQAIISGKYRSNDYEKLKGDFPQSPSDNELCSVKLMNVFNDWKIIEEWKKSDVTDWYYLILLHFKNDLPKIE